MVNMKSRVKIDDGGHDISGIIFHSNVMEIMT